MEIDGSYTDIKKKGERLLILERFVSMDGMNPPYTITFISNNCDFTLDHQFADKMLSVAFTFDNQNVTGLEAMRYNLIERKFKGDA